MNAMLMMMLAADSAVQIPPEVLLLDFTASYCQPCQQMLPLLHRMENDGFPIRRIDITEDPKLSRRFHVERIPTLVLLVDGREVKRYQGLTSEQELRDDMRAAARQRNEALSQKKSSSSPPPVPQPVSSPESASPNSVTAANAKNQSNANNGQPVPAESGRTPLSDVFRGIFRPKEFDRPTLRAQSPEAEPALNEVISRPLAATIRVRVSSDKMQDVGTGTIIHSTAGKSIILTCAHLFQNMTTKPQVEVDIFQNGASNRYPATILGGSHDLDLAVLQIQNAQPLPVVELCRQPETFKPGQPVFSLGCDNGQPPSLLQSKIIQVNRYNGHSNLTCEKDPVQGRSGGGLFDEQGRLLAVCSAADRVSKEGLYMSIPAITSLLQKLSLDYVLQPVTASAGEEVSAGLLTEQSPDSMLEQPSSPTPVLTAEVAASPFPERSAPPAFDDAPRESADAATEITVLIQSKDPAIGKRMIVIPQATPWLLELLTGEAAAIPDQGTHVTSARRPVSSSR